MEGVEDAALEVRARVGGGDGLAGFQGEGVVADAEDVEFDVGCDERHFVQQLRVEGQAVPAAVVGAEKVDAAGVAGVDPSGG
ncbi:hypothetical protein [Streptomyces sp. KS_16]|uniref:hypothetical protein n=1 Tax=unclassified Streptomyces TaxID=2593676 RepID=UPI0035250EB8